MEKKWKNEWKWKKKRFGKINRKSREFVKVADLYLLVVRTTLKWFIRFEHETRDV